MQGIRLRVPEMLDKAGYSVPAIIEKHLGPKLRAKELKLAQHEGKFTDERQVDAHGIQMQAIDTILKMHGAYAPKDPADTEQVGVKVIILDVPRPRRDGVVMPDIGPSQFKAMQQSGDGHKTQE